MKPGSSVNATFCHRLRSACFDTAKSTCVCHAAPVRFTLAAMDGDTLNIMAVASSLNGKSVTRVAILDVAAALEAAGCNVDVLDLAKEALPLVNTDTTFTADYYAALKERVIKADVYVLGTPDYHGGMSGALKNFLDHFWKEFSGKLFAPIVASHEKGLTVHDQIRTVARQCYGWSLPYAVSFNETEDIAEGSVKSDYLKGRLEILVGDVQAYGNVIAAQRKKDLSGDTPGFMAQLRKK
jgi:FMN reductase